jgi:hypothetical protein
MDAPNQLGQIPGTMLDDPSSEMREVSVRKRYKKEKSVVLFGEAMFSVIEKGAG